jgi:hypothetical protein
MYAGLTTSSTSTGTFFKIYLCITIMTGYTFF